MFQLDNWTILDRAQLIYFCWVTLWFLCYVNNTEKYRPGNEEMLDD